MERYARRSFKQVIIDDFENIVFAVLVIGFLIKIHKHGKDGDIIIQRVCLLDDAFQNALLVGMVDITDDDRNTLTIFHNAVSGAGAPAPS